MVKIDLDNTIRPQDDFFHYVNNHWLKQNPIPDSESRWGSFFILRDEAWKNMHMIYESLQSVEDLQTGTIEQQARDFYYTGINYSKFTESHLRTIDKYFNKIDQIKNTHELSEIIGKLHKIGVNAPWLKVVDADDKNSQIHILRIHQSGLTLPDRDYYLSDAKTMKVIRSKYKEHLTNIALWFPKVSKDSSSFADAVFEIEKKLAEHSKSRTELRDAEANYHKITYQKLKSTYKNIDWDIYASSLGWKTCDKITNDQPEFMSYINEMYIELPLDQWKQYLKWQFLLPLYGRINEDFAIKKFEFFGKVLSGTKELLPLWKRVVTTIDDGIGEGVGHLYVGKHFPIESKNKVLNIVEQIREAYAERITSLEWMDPDTKEYALKKLRAIKVLIGFPNEWRDYSRLSIIRESYIENIIASEENDTIYELHKLHQPTSRDEWFMYPQTVNAYHDPNRLVICFPAAILQSPFFDPKASDEENFGGIGTVIGHEFTHGFDDQGCEFDAEGNLRNWRTEKDKQEFHKRAKLIIDQADNFEVIPGIKLQGNLIIGEAIADLGGVEIALHALKKLKGNLTDEQYKYFFIANAIIERGHTRDEKAREYALNDPHPPEVFRINATLQHVDQFHDVYEVREDDTLYRSQKQRAKIW